MKTERKSLPPELLPEIIDNLPIDLRWSELRISLYFDAFLFKKQSKQIISIKKFLYQLYQLFKSANTCLKNWKPLLASDDSTLSNLRNRLDQLCGPYYVLVIWLPMNQNISPPLLKI
uniref:Uncharacterized protein n=1 Tax=Meloidogyne enterolobii TaxID=390850 RepID=A0A6V7TW33_MELEN|nr:unnamed protein product [Meloidogyne enterolobii]